MNSQRWRLRFRVTDDRPLAVVPSSVSPRPTIREGDTFAPARILAMDEPLAVLYGTSQALASCAMASPELQRGNSGSISVKVPSKERA